MEKYLKVSYVPESNNWGDNCNPYILNKLNIPFVWVDHEIEKKVTMIGSVIFGSTRPNTYVWGAGLMKKGQKINNKGIFTAVRGPRTLNRLETLGVDISNISVGDPAILLPRIYQPSTEKKYKLGIIFHMSDGVDIKKFMKLNREKFKNTLLITSNRKLNQMEDYIDEVYSCEKILSTSLHGVICSHAYNVPVKWWKLSDNLIGDDTKFYDHFESLGLNVDEQNLKVTHVENEDIEIENTNHKQKLNQNADKLWERRPWDNVDDSYYVDITKEDWIKECSRQIYYNKVKTNKELNFKK